MEKRGVVLCCVREKEKEKVFLSLKRLRLLHSDYSIIPLRKKEEEVVKCFLCSLSSPLSWDFAIPLLRLLNQTEEEHILSLFSLSPSSSYSSSSLSFSQSESEGSSVIRNNKVFTQIQVEASSLLSLHPKRTSDSLTSSTLKYLSDTLPSLLSQGSDLGMWMKELVSHLMHKYEKLGDVLLFQESPSLLRLLSLTPKTKWREHEEFSGFLSSLPSSSSLSSSSSSSSSSLCEGESSLSSLSSSPHVSQSLMGRPCELEAYWKSEGWEWMRVIGAAVCHSSPSLRTVGLQVREKRERERDMEREDGIFSLCLEREKKNFPFFFERFFSFLFFLFCSHKILFHSLGRHGIFKENFAFPLPLVFSSLLLPPLLHLSQHIVRMGSHSLWM